MTDRGKERPCIHLYDRWRSNRAPADLTQDRAERDCLAIGSVIPPPDLGARTREAHLGKGENAPERLASLYGLIRASKAQAQIRSLAGLILRGSFRRSNGPPFGGD